MDNSSHPILTRDERRQQFVEAGWWVSIPLATVSAHWFCVGENRLDAGYYAQDATAALRIVNDCGYQVEPLKKVIDRIFILNRFRRIYANDKDSGYPYLSASEVLDFRPKSNRFIAKDLAPKNYSDHFAQPNWLLITASGTVGRMVIATNRLSRYFLTHDLIRIIPNNNIPCGFLYAYLSSKIGQILISKDQYGSAIKHLEPHHLASVPVPLLPDTEQQSIHNEIMQSYALRDEANDLLDEAERLLYNELGLPVFDENLVPYLHAPKDNTQTHHNMPHPKAFSIQASELDNRFDGSFHEPITHTIIKLLQNGKYPVEKLEQMVGNIIVAPRFKRIYVPREYGIPFLQGSHIPQMRPLELKYISRTLQKNLEKWIIHKDWVLVTCSGTIGRVGLVTSYQDGWAASQHLLRIIPERNKCNSGYLTAFLMSPYGQHQILAKTYGGVVDEITSGDTGNILIPKPPEPVQEKIGKLVFKAFEKKDNANFIEESAIRHLEQKLKSTQQ